MSAEAEASVVGSLLTNSRIIGEVVGTLLAPEHFERPALRLLYGAILDAYYADEPSDALTVAGVNAKRLAGLWRCDEPQAIARVKTLSSTASGSGREALAHAKLVKRNYDYRALKALAGDIISQVSEEARGPEELAGLLAQRATQIATSSLLTHELVDFEQLGRHYIQHVRELKAARDAGLEVGVKFGFDFIDSYTRGLRPSYLYFLAGEPGVGKSGLAWILALAFAERQLARPEDKRIGTLVCSLEMSEEVSSTRIAQNLTGFDGGKLQEGELDEPELAELIAKWRPRRKMPLFFNFSSTVRASQMRALVSEAIRRHNVGLVIVDHLRYFHMDEGGYRRREDEDEDKAAFLKEAVAKDLGVAVICLAHTTKGIDATDDRRPRLSHLRGGGMVAAHADFVAFLYQPFLHASKKEIDDGKVKRTDAELIYAKNRHQLTRTARLYFDPATMSARDSRRED